MICLAAGLLRAAGFCLPLGLPVCLVGAAAWCWFSGGARYLRLLEVLLAVGLAEGRALGLTVT